jgi:hypothetical protein
MNTATAIAGAGTDGDVTPARLGLGAHEHALRMEFNPASGVLGLIGGQNPARQLHCAAGRQRRLAIAVTTTSADGPSVTTRTVSTGNGTFDQTHTDVIVHNGTVALPDGERLQRQRNTGRSNHHDT